MGGFKPAGGAPQHLTDREATLAQEKAAPKAIAPRTSVQETPLLVGHWPDGGNAGWQSSGDVVHDTLM